MADAELPSPRAFSYHVNHFEFVSAQKSEPFKMKAWNKLFLIAILKKSTGLVPLVQAERITFIIEVRGGRLNI